VDDVDTLIQLKDEQLAKLVEFYTTDHLEIFLCDLLQLAPLHLFRIRKLSKKLDKPFFFCLKKLVIFEVVFDQPRFRLLQNICDLLDRKSLVNQVSHQVASSPFYMFRKFL
jgi:hypothetical protein